MASAPLMPEPASLEGAWRIERDGAACDLMLGPAAEPLSADSVGAPMLAARTGDDCAGLEAIVGWRPAPLGFELTRRDGSTALFFEQTGPSEYRSTDQVWRIWRP